MNRKTVTTEAPRLVRIKEVQARTGLGRSTIYHYAKQGRFPRPVALTSVRATAWVEQEVSDWVSKRIAQRDEEVANVR